MKAESRKQKAEFTVTLSREDGEGSQNGRIESARFAAVRNPGILRPFAVFAAQGDVIVGSLA